MTATALQHRDAIISGLAAGKRIDDLKLPVSRQAISKALRSDPEYREAIESGLEARLDLAEQGIENAALKVDVTRAGTLYRAVAWRAEREVPERWGAKTELRGSRDAPLFEHSDRDTMILELARTLAITLAAAAQHSQPAPALLEHDATQQSENSV